MKGYPFVWRRDLRMFSYFDFGKYIKIRTWKGTLPKPMMFLARAATVDPIDPLGPIHNNGRSVFIVA